MKIAIATEENKQDVSSHFGHSKGFTIYECQQGKILEKKYYENLKDEYGSVPKFLKEMGVDLVIASGMGRNAYNKLKEYNIESILGASGEIDNLIKMYLEGSLHSDETKVHENTPGHGHHGEQHH